MTRLDFDLIVRKTSWQPWLSALLVVTALAIQELGTEALAQRTQERLAALQALRAQAPPEGGAQAPERNLLRIRYDGLAQAEYALAFDQAGGFWTYQVDLPLRGPYRDLRRFVDEALHRIPYAALEQVEVKRDGIGSPSVEARLRFVFHLKDGAA